MYYPLEHCQHRSMESRRNVVLNVCSANRISVVRMNAHISGHHSAKDKSFQQKEGSVIEGKVIAFASLLQP